MASEGSAASGDGGQSRRRTRRGSDSTLDRAYAFLPEDLGVLERKNSARKDCLEEQTLDVVGVNSHRQDPFNQRVKSRRVIARGRLVGHFHTPLRHEGRRHRFRGQADQFRAPLRHGRQWARSEEPVGRRHHSGDWPINCDRRRDHSSGQVRAD
jgi:hypothetical protein